MPHNQSGEETNTLQRLDERITGPDRMMTAAAHTVVLGPKTAQLSPDYVGPAREIVEKATGGLSLFLLGAAGNVNPACGIGTGGQDQYDDLDRMGAMLAGEVLTTGTALGQRVTLRAGDRAIASGELVDVDGEVGVRVLGVGQG